MTKEEYLQDVKNHLRNNKNEWYNKRVLVDGHSVGLKFFGKDMQRMEVDGIQYGGLYDIPTQKAFLKTISDNMDW